MLDRCPIATTRYILASMRICYLGDANVQVRRVAEYFARAGNDVHVVTARPAPIPGVPVHSFAGPLARGKAAFLLGIPSARRIISRLRPDVLHVFYATSYGLVASMIPGPPVVLSPMGSDLLISAETSRLFSTMVRRAIRRADAIFSVAPHMTRKLLAFGALPSRIHTFPRGVDLERFPFMPRSRPSAQSVVLSNRKMEKVYNIEQLVRAAPLVLARFPDVRFVFYGDGSQRGDLERLAASVGAGDSCSFRGAVDHDVVASTLDQADLYVSCSRSDGTSVSLLEAMASGLYPIVSDIEANRSWIRDRDNGMLFRLDDPASLADAIGSVVSAGGASPEALKANRRLIETEADWGLNMPRMGAVYRSLAGSA